MFRRFTLTLGIALLATALSIGAAAAQWPTTCVALNDIVEAHLGNYQNVGIYQRVFGDQAEQACQNDHRDDVRAVFAWAIGGEEPATAPAPPPTPPTPTASAVWTAFDDKPIQVEVLGYDPDGWRELVIENQFNDPPRNGHRYLLVSVKVTNPGSTPVFVGSAFDLQSGERRFTEFGEDSRCGVVPNALADVTYAIFDQVSLPAHAQVTGTLCFQVPEASRNLSLVAGTTWTGGALRVVGAEALPATDWTGIERECRCRRTRLDGGCDRRFSPVMTCSWVAR